MLESLKNVDFGLSRHRCLLCVVIVLLVVYSHINYYSLCVDNIRDMKVCVFIG